MHILRRHVAIPGAAHRTEVRDSGGPIFVSVFRIAIACRKEGRIDWRTVVGQYLARGCLHSLLDSRHARGVGGVAPNAPELRVGQERLVLHAVGDGRCRGRRRVLAEAADDVGARCNRLGFERLELEARGHFGGDDATDVGLEPEGDGAMLAKQVDADVLGTLVHERRARRLVTHPYGRHDRPQRQHEAERESDAS